MDAAGGGAPRPLVNGDEPKTPGGAGGADFDAGGRGTLLGGGGGGPLGPFFEGGAARPRRVFCFESPEGAPAVFLDRLSKTSRSDPS